MLDFASSFLYHKNALITDPSGIFFVVLVIILSAPLMRRLRVPHIVGMILAGVLIGPHGLHLIDRDRSFEIFGQVGVYYIMFMAALELDMGSVQKYGRRGMEYGLLTFFVPFFLGFLSSRWLLDMHPITSVLMGCIYGSHTLVSYPIVGRYGLAKHRTVVVAVVSTAVATMAALLTLAMVLELRKPDVGWRFWVLFFFRCVAYFSFVGLLLPRMARWFLRRFDDSILHFTFILAVVFLSAVLAKAAGLEGLLGAFLAGLVLGRLIPRTSPLMNRIEFVGNALFIPYFLIGVGMLVDLGVLFSDLGTIWMVLLVVVTATLVKLLPAIAAKWIFKDRWMASMMLFGLTNAHSAGALAMVMIASAPAVGLMDAGMINATVMLILCSCIISSYATSYAARSLALSETETEGNRGSFHGKCLVAYSQSSNVEMMTQLGMLIRNPYIPESLLGLNVAFSDRQDPGNAHNTAGKQLLEQAQKIAAAADVPLATLSRMATNAATGILYTLSEYDCGEVVVSLADRTTGMPKSSLGTVLDNIIAGTHREVIALRAIVPLGTLRRIVVAVPAKAEYEVGFFKWVEHICRMGEQLDCRIHFHAHEDTLPHIRHYMKRIHRTLRVEYTAMNLWGRLLNLSTQVGGDDLLVVVTARPGFISYRSVFDGLPLVLHRYFSKVSLILLYPDQWGDPANSVSIFAPNGTAVRRRTSILQRFTSAGR